MSHAIVLDWRWVWWFEGLTASKRSDAHRHQDVAVLHIFVRVLGTHLSSALGVFELQPDLAGVANRLQKIDQVLAVEPNHQRIVVVWRLDRIL